MATVRYSARQIAEKIQRPDEAPSSAMNRLKNWTNEGFVKPLGDSHPGTGRARQYSSQALTDAVMLQIITNATGMSAVEAHELLTGKRWNLKGVREEGSWFVLSRKIGVDAWAIGWCRLEFMPQHFDKSSYDTHVVIDLGKVLRKFDIGEV
jgi:hypothetical protein